MILTSTVEATSLQPPRAYSITKSILSAMKCSTSGSHRRSLHYDIKSKLVSITKRRIIVMDEMTILECQDIPHEGHEDEHQYTVAIVLCHYTTPK
jgi:hypothetical protein